MSETDRAFWQEAWGTSGSAQRYLTLPTGFEPMFARYFSRADKARPVDFLEIGCFPGRFLYYFAKQFDFRVHGLDFVPQAADIPCWLAALGVEARVTVADFFLFKPERGYDVVASFGFVEHFATGRRSWTATWPCSTPGGLCSWNFPISAMGNIGCAAGLTRPFLTVTSWR